jgi:hypothetical protein
VPPVYRPKLWHLAVVLLIAVFDLGVLYMVLRPNVSPEYRAYYIDRTSSCFPRVISGFYPLGEPVSFNSVHNGYNQDTIRWCGFLPPSPTGIRSFGDYGILHLEFPDPGEDLLLTFESWTNTDSEKPKRDVDVVVNGEHVAVLTYAGAGRVDGSIIIPERLVKAGNGMMEIRFDVPRTGPPGTNGEPVTLQLRLESLRLVKLSEAPPQPAQEPHTAPHTRPIRE